MVYVISIINTQKSNIAICHRYEADSDIFFTLYMIFSDLVANNKLRGSDPTRKRMLESRE